VNGWRWQRRVVVLRQLDQVVEVGVSVVGEVAGGPDAIAVGEVVVLRKADQVVEVDGAVEGGVAEERVADQDGRGASTACPAKVPPAAPRTSDASAYPRAVAGLAAAEEEVRPLPVQ
jgi:hypothetical protein